ncbi:MAG: hypothetical protein GY791_08340 [Alphaproteobacteria bacterium]|nr:hypothetical protein [Alphaproteobacteria bacterium]
MSDVEICNRALQKIGAEARITSLDDDTKEARECGRAYDPVRRAALRLHPWNFALARASVASLSVAPAWGYAHQFPWPADALRILRVDGDGTGAEWRVEGHRVLSDGGGPLNVLYVADIADTALFDSQFREVCAHLLAIELAEPISQSNTKKQILRDELGALLAGATRADAQEGTPESLPEDAWIVARA